MPVVIQATDEMQKYQSCDNTGKTTSPDYQDTIMAVRDPFTIREPFIRYYFF